MLHILSLLLITTSLLSFSQTGERYKIFFLKESSGKLSLDTLSIGEGESINITRHGFVTFILPVGPGKSGDIIQEIHRNNSLILSTANGNIFVKIIKPDGGERALPAVKISDLKKYLIRVNVTGGSGIKNAFYIKGYNEAGEADGPVIDLFGGKIPLGKNDFSITTEVTEDKKKEFISGSAPLEIYNNLLFVKGKISGEAEAYFIIDFGAGRTLFSKEYIPKENIISAIEGIEYSSEGAKIIKGEMGAAGGNVSALLGNTVIDNFKLGSILISDLPVSVIENLPEIAGKEIAGIIGMDILQRAPVVSLEYNYGEVKKIIFQEDFVSTAKYEKISFSLTGKQIFIKGEINEKPVNFLFDTGARYSFVSEGLKFKTLDSEAKEVRGLDGNVIPAKPVDAEKFTLAGIEFSFKDFYAADLHVMNSMGLKESGAILGGNFFTRFKNVSLDFRNKLIYLEK